jgi:hypothetical protein
MALIGRALRCLPAMRISAVVSSQAVNTPNQIVPRRTITEKSIADLESKKYFITIKGNIARNRIPSSFPRLIFVQLSDIFLS